MKGQTIGGLTCFLVVVPPAKFEEREEKVAKLCNYHTQSTTTSANKEDYLQMELLLLQFFEWNVAVPTAAHFLSYFLTEAAGKGEKFHEDNRGSEYSNIYMQKYTHYFLEISLQGKHSTVNTTVRSKLIEKCKQKEKTCKF